ncbi:glycosyltransferase [Roseovarius salis]|uniref:glycosyltransferase n=1 Tax=Roseovarius salis TaxID=3376063 RepID=UPI0037CA0284
MQRVWPWLYRGNYALLSGAHKLFDRRFYLLMNPDVAETEMDPIQHYLVYGADEGRNPSAVFNTLYYRRKMPQQERWMNPLVHFLRHGAGRGISPTPFFNHDIYASRNRDVAAVWGDLFEHYVRHGVHENRVATDIFDPQRYLAENPEARQSGMSALAHYLCVGDARGAIPMHYAGVGERRADGTCISLPPGLKAEIAALAPQGPETPVLDVIVPVYRGREETLSCIWHALRSRGEVAFELVVVDDCSPEPGLSRILQGLADSGHVTLLRNEENLGFVKSVNRGMQLHPDRDVILLNSDTEVYHGWVDRLHAAARSDKVLGTLTPLTNNGTICSYPHFAEDNPHTLEVDYETLDRIAGEANAQAAPVPAPTAVGFAMYIKREVIDEVGYFDEEAFGTGYGEENDFCQRAQAAGWLDMIATNVVIRHLGSMSFQEEKADRVRHATAVIDSRYPDYSGRVQRFLATDPLRAHRARIDMERLERLVADRNVLVISHNRGGGTEQFIQQDCARMARDGISVFRMRADSPRRDRVMHFHAEAPDLPNLRPLDFDSDRDEIVALWRRLGIQRIDIHHIADFGRHGARRLLALLEASGLPWRYCVHDYLPLCPRITLSDDVGVYCGEPDSAGCRRCLQAQHSEFGLVDIDWWRDENRRLLSGAEECVVPDRDVAERLTRYWPEIPVRVEAHDCAAPGRRPVRSRGLDRGDGVLRVGIIGAISTIKGYHYVLDCARLAQQQQMPVKFVVVGYTKDDRRAAEAGMEVTGRYSHEEVFDRLEEQELDVIFVPSRLPETYSFALSYAIDSGLPIIVFDIGAPPSRLRDLKAENCHILPLETKPKGLLKLLGQMRQTGLETSG